MEARERLSDRHRAITRFRQSSRIAVGKQCTNRAGRSLMCRRRAKQVETKAVLELRRVLVSTNLVLLGHLLEDLLAVICPECLSGVFAAVLQ